MMRSSQPGWIRCTPYDRAGRRAVWLRYDGDAVELCGGPEGDTCYVRLVPGAVLTPVLIQQIVDPLLTTADMIGVDEETRAWQVRELGRLADREREGRAGRWSPDSAEDLIELEQQERDAGYREEYEPSSEEFFDV